MLKSEHSNQIVTAKKGRLQGLEPFK